MTNIGYAPSCTEYSVHFGQFFFFNQTENVFFPHQWTRVCPSLDLVTSKETPMFFFLGPWWTVDGGQLLGEEEYKREEDNLFEIWINRDLDENMNYLIIMIFSTLLKWLP